MTTAWSSNRLIDRPYQGALERLAVRTGWPFERLPVRTGWPFERLPVRTGWPTHEPS